jgi:hypothetical protein
VTVNEVYSLKPYFEQATNNKINNKNYLQMVSDLAYKDIKWGSPKQNTEYN